MGDEALVQRVIERWKAGASFGEIADEARLLFGVSLTRSAIAGKIDRLGLLRTKQKYSPRPHLPNYPPSEAPSHPRRLPPLGLVPQGPPGPTRDLEFAELEFGDCQYPVKDNPTRFCGRPLWRGSYCFECWRRTHLPQVKSA